MKGSEKNKENYFNGKHPDYYTGKYKGIKAIDVIFDFDLPHCKASALEYILRSGKKDDEEDSSCCGVKDVPENGAEMTNTK